MGASNLTQDLNDALVYRDEVFKLDPLIQQCIFGATSQHITRESVWVSGSEHRKVLKEQFTGARVTDDLDADAHSASQILVEDLEIPESSFRRLGFTLQRDLLVSKSVSGGAHSCFDIARELVLEGKEAVGEKRNILLNSNGDCVIGYVAAVYDPDGTAYTSTATTALVQITKGSISAFRPGLYVQIRAASDNTDIRLKGKVEGVIYDENFRGNASVGPGIIVSIQTDGIGSDDGDQTNFDTTQAAAASTTNTDEIVASGETDENYPAAFGALADLGTTPGTYFGKTRTAVGNEYLIPMGRHWDSDGDGTGTAVPFVVNTHMGTMIRSFSRMLCRSREYRKNHRYQLTKAIVCQAPPPLCEEMASQIGTDNVRFTKKMASDLSEAMQRNLVAVGGWDGAVLRSATSIMPVIALQEEQLMDPGTIRLFEPSAFEWIRMHQKETQFIPNAAGGFWHNRRHATTGNLQYQLDAFGFVNETIFCDQPRMLYHMDGLTDSLD